MQSLLSAAFFDSALDLFLFDQTGQVFFVVRDDLIDRWFA